MLPSPASKRARVACLPVVNDLLIAISMHDSQFGPTPSVQEVACIASGLDEGRNEGILRKEGQQGILNRPSRTEARRATSLAGLLTLNTPGPPRPQPPVGFFSASMMSSTLKLDGLWRGGKSLKVATNWPTMACVGTTRNAWRMLHS